LDVKIERKLNEKEKLLLKKASDISTYVFRIYLNENKRIYIESF